MFCSSCGKEIPAESKFCPFCGNSVSANANTTTAEAHNTGSEQNSLKNKIAFEDNSPDRELLEAYITGNNDYSSEHATYFREVYKAFDINGTPDFKLKWNWSAFFFDFAYMWYRKAYLEGFIVLLLSCIPIAGFILWLICGGCANYALYQRFLRKQEKLKSALPNDHARQVQEMKDFGGVNRFIKTLMILIAVAIVVIVIFCALAAAIE